ncbi:hypothetical protein Tco_0817843 [Tanacetum coccineum]
MTVDVTGDYVFFCYGKSRAFSHKIGKNPRRLLLQWSLAVEKRDPNKYRDSTAYTGHSTDKSMSWREADKRDDQSRRWNRRDAMTIEAKESALSITWDIRDGEEDGTRRPMIIEAEIGGHLVHRIYVCTWRRPQLADNGPDSLLNKDRCRRAFNIRIDELHGYRSPSQDKWNNRQNRKLLVHLNTKGRQARVPVYFVNRRRRGREQLLPKEKLVLLPCSRSKQAAEKHLPGTHNYGAFRIDGSGVFDTNNPKGEQMGCKKPQQTRLDRLVADPGQWLYDAKIRNPRLKEEEGKDTQDELPYASSSQRKAVRKIKKKAMAVLASFQIAETNKNGNDWQVPSTHSRNPQRTYPHTRLRGLSTNGIDSSGPFPRFAAQAANRGTGSIATMRQARRGWKGKLGLKGKTVI